MITPSIHKSLGLDTIALEVDYVDGIHDFIPNSLNNFFKTTTDQQSSTNDGQTFQIIEINMK